MKKLFVFIIILSTTLPALSQSYKKLHKKAIVVDTHNDFPQTAVEKQLSFDDDLHGQTHSDLKRMIKGGVDVEVFSIFCDGDEPQPYAAANRQIDSIYEWTRRNHRKMTIVKTPAELKLAVKQKRLAAMMGVEGGHMIENSLDKLNALYDRGARYMTLTWNNSTSWASSAMDETQRPDSLSHKGLNDFGKQIVRRMNELGMIVDISHNGEQTFWDALAVTTKPVIASHSSVYNICPHFRNLKDEQIKAIAKNGGVIHLNFYAGFLDSAYEKERRAFNNKHRTEINELIDKGASRFVASQTIAKKYSNELTAIIPKLSVLIDHLDYIVKLVGVDHVGLGSDFDGISQAPLELTGVQDLPLITKALKERGYSKKDIEKILGGNFIRVFEEVQRK